MNSKKYFLPALLLAVLLSMQAQGADYNYADALEKSLYFYDAEKSGPGITGGRLEWRGDSELDDQWVPLSPVNADGAGTNMSQGFIDANREFLDPDGNGTMDLSGGYHDAGDHVKFGLPQGYSASTLGWGFYEFRDAFERTGLAGHMVEVLKWFTDYFLRSTFLDDQGEVVAFCYQVGDGDVDHTYWGPPELQRVIDFPRPAFFATTENPASDQCAEAAASLAIMYLNMLEEDPAYADECLQKAEALYRFAVNNRGLGFSGGYYGSSFDEDEMSWAAVWLYIATGTDQYLQDVVSVSEDGNYTGYLNQIIKTTANTWQNIWVHCWDTVWGGVFMKLQNLLPDEKYDYIARWNLEYWTGGSIPHEDATDMSYLTATAAGFAVRNSWGSARYNAAAQLCALVYRKDTGRSDFADWAKSQMDYIMGDSPIGYSLIVGFTDTYAEHPHHRAAHGSNNNSMTEPAEHRHILWGALVGGPDSDDAHKDEVPEYAYNEVAIDYNAAFVGALAGFVTFYGPDDMPPENFPPAEAPVDEMYAQAKLEQENTERTQVTITLFNKTVHPPRFDRNLSVRYYFDISELYEFNQTIADVSVDIMYDENDAGYDGPVQVIGPIAVDEPNGIYYVEFAWEGYDIYGEREIHFALIESLDASFNSHWDPTNDWSRQGITAEHAKTTYIPVYSAGELVFGEEPPPVPPPTPEPTPGPGGPTPTPGLETMDLKVQYQCNVATALSNSVEPWFNIINDGTIPVSYEDLTLRYYFSSEPEGPQNFNISHAVVGYENVTGSFGDGYTEIAFTPEAGVLGKTSESGQIQVRINSTDWGTYDQSNDYSFNGDFTEELTLWDQVTLYYQGTLVWGTEPGGTTTPTPEPYILGDADKNGMVNIVDALMTAQVSAGMEVASFNPDAADVNGDGQANIIDALLIARYSAGLISEF